MNEQAKTDQVKLVFPHAAAKVALVALLATKTKGDHITAREVLEATGMTVDELRGAIKRWAKKTAVVVRAVPNDGYRILTDQEHSDEMRRKAESAFRQEKEALRVGITTDQSKLDDTQTRRLNHLIPRTAARVAIAERDVKDTRKEFRLTERTPLRVLTRGDVTDERDDEGD